MEAYCVKCKTKREVQNPQADFNAVGAPVTKGTCGVCGTRLFRMGHTPEHDSLPQPTQKGKKPVIRSGKLVIVEFAGQG